MRLASRLPNESHSGTGLLITERIPFGSNGIEGQYQKCMDYDMPDQVGHYRALLGAVARLAGTDAAGRLPNQLGADMRSCRSATDRRSRRVRGSSHGRASVTGPASAIGLASATARPSNGT